MASISNVLIDVLHHPRLPLLALSSGDTLILFNTAHEEPSVLFKHQIAPSTVHNMPRQPVITHMAWSVDGRAFGFTQSDKMLVRAEVDSNGQWAIWSTVAMKKRTSVICFTTKQKTEEAAILFADNFGDVYKLQRHADALPEQIMGHVSSVADMLLVKDDSFLLTCDKDEKIRVTHYPQTFIIHNFCFGHRQFVSAMCQLSNGRLISGGGDPDILVWDYLKGELLAKLNVLNVIKEKLDLELSSKEVAVRSIRPLFQTSDVAALILEDLPAVFVINWMEENRQLVVEHILELEDGSNPLGLSVDSHGRLFVSSVKNGENRQLISTLKVFEPEGPSSYKSVPKLAQHILDVASKDQVGQTEELLQSSLSHFEVNSFLRKKPSTFKHPEPPKRKRDQ